MLRNRYLVQIIMMFLMGVAGAMFFNVPALLLYIYSAVISLLLSASFILYKKKKIKISYLLASILLFAFAIGHIYSNIVTKEKFPEIIESDVTFCGYICEKNEKYTDIEVLYGDIDKGIKIRVYRLENKDRNNFPLPYYKGTFNLTLSPCPDYIKADNIAFYGSGYVNDLKPYNGNPISKSAYISKTFISEKIDYYFSENEKTRGFIKAVVLGDTSEISDDMYSDYSRLGITHIIAVSGLHFTIVILTLFIILEKLRFGLTCRSLICIPFAIFYCFMTGSPPSAVRALIMMIIFLIGRSLLYLMDSMTSLAIAAAIICIINPYSFYSTGFTLSFAATFAITIAPSFLNLPDFYHQPKKIKKIDSVVQSIFITSIISMIIFPVLAERFNIISIITPLSNLLVSALFPFIMYISLCTCILSLFNIPDFIIYIVNYIIEGFHRIIQYLSSLKGIAIIPSDNLISIVLILIFICVFSGLFFKKRPRGIIIRCTVVLFLVVLIINSIYINSIIKKTEKISVSDECNSVLIVSENKIILICENENSIDANFVYKNRFIDINSLILIDIIDAEYAEYKVSQFVRQCKLDYVYTNSEIKCSDATVLSLEKLDLELYDFSYKESINFSFMGEKSFMILSDNIDSVNKDKNINKLILTDKFFNNKRNLYSLPESIDEVYVNKDYINHPFLIAIKNNYKSEIHPIEDFTY